MTDRELLELAAKAAGIVGEWDRDTAFIQERWRFMTPYHNHGMMTAHEWNPLTDDGDALRLAVKLYFHVNLFPPLESYLPMGIPGFVEVWKCDGTDPIHVEYIDVGGDYNAATRRAIVRAAAEIGRAMP